jgi:hypothetical protein
VGNVAVTGGSSAFHAVDEDGVIQEIRVQDFASFGKQAVLLEASSSETLLHNMPHATPAKVWPQLHQNMAQHPCAMVLPMLQATPPSSQAPLLG